MKLASSSFSSPMARRSVPALPCQAFRTGFVTAESHSWLVPGLYFSVFPAGKDSQIAIEVALLHFLWVLSLTNLSIFKKEGEGAKSSQVNVFLINVPSKG